MNRFRSLTARMKELAIAINITFQREGFGMLIRRSVWWLSGERRYKKNNDAPYLPSFVPYGDIRQSRQVASQSASISYIIVLTGLPAQVEPEANVLLQTLNKWHHANSESEVVVVTDGPIWKHIARVCDPSIRIIHQTEACFLPNRLFQLGLTTCSNDWVVFVLPGVNAEHWFTNATELLNYVQQRDCVAVAGRYGPSDLVSTHSLSSHRVHLLPDRNVDSRYPPVSYPTGWIEMLDMVPFQNCILNRKALIEAGGFAETVVLQRGFWWETCIRLARVGTFAAAPLPAPISKWSLDTFPLVVENAFPLDTRARISIRYHGLADKETSVARDLPEVLHLATFDQNSVTTSTRSVQDAIETIRKTWPANPIKITILSGPYEPHHNQIFFYNYFRLVEGHGLLSWRVIDDEYATTADITVADVLILCRVRSDNGCRMLDWALRLGKPVLYMLDDNWYKMGSEWAEYRQILAPDSTFLRNARYCIRNATAVVTFNPVMRKYLSNDAKRVFEMPMNIDLRLFDPVYPKETRPQLHIGYAGSPRQGQACFEALVNVAQRHRDVMVCYIGWKPPDVIRNISADQLRVVPGTFSLREYAHTLSALNLDIGLAPLENTESDRSKNPTKYLDYAAVYCAGIYSPIEPYTTHVTNRKTGVFVEGSSADAWVSSIEDLMADAPLREHIQMKAYSDVKHRFSTENVLPIFLKMLADLLSLRNST